jgi:hypothetical protein
MSRYSIALVTCSKQPQLYTDERRLIADFARAGCEALPVLWDDPAIDWRAFDRVVLRSTWDYFERIDEFRAWLDRLEHVEARLLNPLPLVRWNLDKLYLRALEQQGIAILPTRFVAAGERVDLAGELHARDWHDAIVKPAVSGGAFRTHRVSMADAQRVQPALDEILAAGGALIQPFAREIVDEGEWSLLFFGGRFSHCVLKTAATGEFRIQQQFGGSAHAVTPAETLLRAAEHIMASLPVAPAYARIDGLRRGEEFLLMEVEVIEPSLFLPAGDEAADRYVRACIDAA